MKYILNPKRKLPETLILGILGLALRQGLYAFGLDEKNLLVPFHPLEISLWAVTVLTVVLILLTVWKGIGSEAYGDNFHPSFPASFGHILAAAGIALTVLLNQPAMIGPVGQLWKYGGLLSAPLLIWAAFCRVLGKKPLFLTYVVVSVFFVFHLVCHYQTWCSNPQLQDYVFAFLACLGLMLFSYYQAAFCVGAGHRRILLGVGLVTLYLCIVNIANTEYLYLYLGCGIWVATGLCDPVGVPLPREKAGEEDAPA